MQRLIDPAFFCAEMTIFCAEPATCCAELVFCCAEPAVFCAEPEPMVCRAESVIFCACMILQFAVLRFNWLFTVLCQQLAVLSWELAAFRLIDPAVFCAEMTIF